MDTLEGTSWDVLISGTGIQQSLLALALSRSGKKIIHIDKNDVYGGSEAALSIQEAETWAENVNSDSWRSPFSLASIKQSHSGEDTPKLGPSRSYNLSLAPTLLYTRSALLPILVSSRAHQQLEFQAVGSWFVYTSSDGLDAQGRGTPSLVRVPNGREDIFADQALSLKAKGAITRFLRFVASYEENAETWEPYKDMPFSDFLTDRFKLPVASHGPLLALSLSPTIAESTSTGFALPRIAHHLRSIGMFGPGFGSVIPKWGGLSEVAQVACRGGAVWGAVYVLGKAMISIEESEVDDDVEEVPRPELSQQDISQEVSDAIGARNFLPTDDSSLNNLETEIKDQSLDELLAAAGYSVAAEESPAPSEPESAQVPEQSEKDVEAPKKLSVRLEGGDSIRTDYVVGTLDDLPAAQSANHASANQSSGPKVSRSISVVSAPMPALFPPTAEGGVTPAGAVIVLPASSSAGNAAQLPVYIIAHTGDTGECPQGQTVLYASIAATGDEAISTLDQSVESLLATQGSDIKVLWSLRYQQEAKSASLSSSENGESNVLCFPDGPLDLAFDDGILDNVKEAWQRITGADASEFMKFEDNDASADDNMDNDDDDA